MLQALRGSIGSFFIKGLLLLLVLSFALWGMGDIFRSRGATDTVATVGTSKLSPDELRSQVDNYIRQFTQNQNVSLNDTPQLRQGIAATAVQSWVAEKLYEQEASRLGLTASEDSIKKMIAEDANFLNPATKQFSPEIFRNLLLSNNLTEQQYLAALRKDMVNRQLAWAFGSALYIPNTLQRLTYQIENEKRSAIVVDVPYEKFPAFSKLLGRDNIGKPTNEELKQHMQDNPQQFSMPEYRKVSLLVLSPDALQKTVRIDETMLKQEYEKRLNDFTISEKREVRQAVFAKEEQAKAAIAKLEQGQNFKSAVKEAGLGKTEVIDLGLIDRASLSSELSEAAFNLKSGQHSAPIKTALGYHVVQVGSVKPGFTKSFESVKAELSETIKQERASEETYKLTNQLQDKIASGATFQELSKEFPVKIIENITTDRGGFNTQSTKIALPSNLNSSKEDILQVAFGTDAGKQSGLAEIKDSGFYVVRVDEITPMQLKDFETARAQVLKDWQRIDREKTGQEIIEKLYAQITSGKTALEISKEYGLDSKPLNAINRNGEGLQHREMIAPLFSSAKGQSFSVPTRDGIAIAMVKDIIPTTNKYDPKSDIGILNSLNQSVSSDIAAQMQQALQQNFDVKINERALQTLY